MNQIDIFEEIWHFIHVYTRSPIVAVVQLFCFCPMVTFTTAGRGPLLSPLRAGRQRRPEIGHFTAAERTFGADGLTKDFDFF